MWWLYTSLENAETELAKVNANIKAFNPEANYAAAPTQLTANPEIEGTTYLYGFSEPPENIQTGAIAELEAQYSQDWFMQEEL
jgi:hypothetical protein